MQLRRYIALALALGLGGVAPPALAQSGTLVIVGGGLKPDNAEVYSAFLDARPDAMPDIAIIAAGSREPGEAADAFREAVARYGVDAKQVRFVKLAIADDPGTKDVDEAGWRNNAFDPAEVAAVTSAGGIWFAGGDQSLLTAALLTADGRDTPMLAAIRARLREGAVIGGTSAGAAIMSDPMITQGDSIAALLPGSPGEPVRTGRGLGLAPGFLVDQHFGQRARLGRLAAVLVSTGQPHRLGLGVDEDTALIFRPGTATARIVGRGQVTVLDARSAKRGGGGSLAISNLSLGFAASGDSIDLAAGGVLPADFRRATIGNEYFDRASLPGGGMALPGQTLAEVVGEGLLDNSATEVIERYSFTGSKGVTFRFTQTGASQGWWGRAPGGEARYAASSVRFDIEPMTVIMHKDQK